MSLQSLDTYDQIMVSVDYKLRIAWLPDPTRSDGVMKSIHNAQHDVPSSGVHDEIDPALKSKDTGP